MFSPIRFVAALAAALSAVPAVAQPIVIDTTVDGQQIFLGSEQIDLVSGGVYTGVGVPDTGDFGTPEGSRSTVFLGGDSSIHIQGGEILAAPPGFKLGLQMHGNSRGLMTSGRIDPRFTYIPSDFDPTLTDTPRRSGFYGLQMLDMASFELREGLIAATNVGIDLTDTNRFTMRGGTIEVDAERNAVFKSTIVMGGNAAIDLFGGVIRGPVARLYRGTIQLDGTRFEPTFLDSTIPGFPEGVKPDFAIGGTAVMDILVRPGELQINGEVVTIELGEVLEVEPLVGSISGTYASGSAFEVDYINQFVGDEGTGTLRVVGAVPEPGSLACLALLGGLALRRRR